MGGAQTHAQYAFTSPAAILLITAVSSLKIFLLLSNSITIEIPKYKLLYCTCDDDPLT